MSSCPESVASGPFFFSSRRRHTRSLCDWSSDVCSSDLVCRKAPGVRIPSHPLCHPSFQILLVIVIVLDRSIMSASTSYNCSRRNNSSSGNRSEERRVGKECRYRGQQHQLKQI